MVRMKRVTCILAFALGVGVGWLPLVAEAEKPVAKPVAETSEALDKSVAESVRKGLDWLAANQREDGSWSAPMYPALTALPLWAFAQSDHPRKKEVVDKAVTYLLGCVRKDGGIYKDVEGQKGGGLSNYNTSLAMVALHAVDDPEWKDKLVPVVLKARAFVARHQHAGEDVYNGGAGYDAAHKRAYADLSNTYMAIEAMRLTQDVEDLRRKGERVDLNWEAAVRFIQNCQNRKGSNPDPGVADGGFRYRPDSNQAEGKMDADGNVRFTSYGSMTYAGLLSFIYAGVGKDDPRVRSAYDWAVNHWTLEENPGMGGEGLYYFYNVLAKALDVYGNDVVKTKDGRRVKWKEEFARHLVGAQRADEKTGGFWLNDAGRWQEKDPVLVTSYSLLALQRVQ